MPAQQYLFQVAMSIVDLGLAMTTKTPEMKTAAPAAAKRKTSTRKTSKVEPSVAPGPEQAVEQIVATIPVDAPPKEIEPSAPVVPEEPAAKEETEVQEITEEPQLPPLELSESGDGWVKISGVTFEHDVIVHLDGSVTKRKKDPSRKKKSKYGHAPLTRKELKKMLREGPELIVIGTGQRGMMPMTPKAEKLLDGCISFIGPTPYALDWMQKEQRKMVALLHVTC